MKRFSSLRPGADAYFCRATQQSFLRLLATPSVFRIHGVPALSNREAWATFDEWSTNEKVSFVEEPPGVKRQWRILSSRTTSSPKL